MSKGLESTLTVCTLVVTAVVLCWWLWPDHHLPTLVVEMVGPLPESSGDRAAATGSE